MWEGREPAFAANCRQAYIAPSVGAGIWPGARPSGKLAGQLIGQGVCGRQLNRIRKPGPPLTDHPAIFYIATRVR